MCPSVALARRQAHPRTTRGFVLSCDSRGFDMPGCDTRCVSAAGMVGGRVRELGRCCGNRECRSDPRGGRGVHKLDHAASSYSWTGPPRRSFAPRALKPLIVVNRQTRKILAEFETR
jgi:hypothetical protein